MKIKVNDKVIMLADSDWWAKGDIGRIIKINSQGSRLICFDRGCTKEHNQAGGHAWWADKKDFKLYRLNRFMKVN
jgi:hypothetical protein